MSILIPIILSILFPFLLWVGGKLQLTPRLRFKFFSLLILSIWTIICLHSLKDSGIGWQWIAGVLVISSAVILFFLPWSVLCWGFTLSMLLRLAKSPKPLNQKQWAEAYAGALGTRGLSKNRATILLAFGFARLDKDDLVLTRRGRLSAGCLRLISYFFGIPR